MFASIHCMNPLHDENETHERMFLYALTLVDVGFNMKVSAAVFFSKCSFQRISQTRRNALRTHFLIGSLRISLVGYVCINPLHDENETHERMLLRTDMGRCRVQHENLCWPRMHERQVVVIQHNDNSAQTRGLGAE